MTSKKASKKSKWKPGQRTNVNKSAFVREQPADASAAAVVAAAKSKGIKLTENYVYTIRSAAKKKKGGPKNPVGRPRSATSIARTPSETGFVEFVLDIGLGRAQALLDQIRTAAKNA